MVNRKRLLVLIMVVSALFLTYPLIRSFDRDNSSIQIKFHSIQSAAQKPTKPQVSTPKPNPETVYAEMLFTQQDKSGDAVSIYILNITSGETVKLIDEPEAAQKLGRVTGSAYFSPDGRKILFAASNFKSPMKFTEDPVFNENLDLWIYNRDTKNLKRLTWDGQGYENPQWSPNGRFVSAESLGGWTSPDGPTTEAGVFHDEYLYVWDTVTGHKYTVGRQCFNARWKPDSLGLLTTTNNDSNYYLYIWSMKAGKIQVDNGVNSAVWTPDGTGIIYNRFSNNVLKYTKSSGKPVITLEPTVQYVDFGPWSPKTKSVVYSGLDSPLLLYDFTSKKTKKITEYKGFYTSSWSPEGTLLAVLEKIQSMMIGRGSSVLSVYDMQAGKSRKVYTGDENVQILDWSKGGETILLYLRSTNTVLGVSASDGSSHILRDLPDGDKVNFKDWKLLKS